MFVADSHFLVAIPLVSATEGQGDSSAEAKQTSSYPRAQYSGIVAEDDGFFETGLTSFRMLAA